MTPDQIYFAMGTSGAGSASNVTIQAQYALQTAVNAQTADATLNASSTDWAACIATYKSSSSVIGDPKIMDNGVETSIVLTTTVQMFTKISTTAVYPTNIGIRSTGQTPDTYLYECGEILAYIPGPFQQPPFLHNQALRRAASY
jgi:hypothetical protein